MGTRVSQEPVQLTGSANPHARVSQVPIQLVGPAVPHARVSQVPIQLVGPAVPHARVSDVPVQVAGNAHPHARVSQVVVHVAAPNGTPIAGGLNAAGSVVGYSLVVTPNPDTLPIDQIQKFTATLVGTDGSVVHNPPVIWSSTAGFIDFDGTLHPDPKLGTYTVTATLTADPIEITKACEIDARDFALAPTNFTPVARFAPDYWTTDFPSTAFGAVVSGTNSVTLTVEMNSTSDFIGLQWGSADPYDHPLLQYVQNDRYDGITWSFHWATSTTLPPLSSVSQAPALTVVYDRLGPGIKTGQFQILGNAIAGQKLSVILKHGSTTVVTSTYTVLTTDNPTTLAAEAVSLINASAAVTGGGAWLANAQVVAGGVATVALQSLHASDPDYFSFEIEIVGNGVYASPAAETEMLATVYIYLKNYAQVGWTNHSADIIINWDTVHSGVNSSDPSWAPVDALHISKMFFAATPTNYSPINPLPLSGGSQVGTLTLSSMSVTSNVGTSPNATLLVGTIPSPGTNGIGIATDLPANYNITPRRLVNAAIALGYTQHFDCYVGPSKHYCLVWNAGRSQFEVDSTKTINAAATAWFTELLTRLHAASIPATVAISLEILTSQIPTNWDQQDWFNNSAETAYSNPTTLARFMDSTVRAWLKSIFVAFGALIPSGADVTIQLGEIAWWSGQDNGPTNAVIGPCIFDFPTRVAYNTATGFFAPEIDSVVPFASLNAAQQAYVTWVGDQLGVFTDEVILLMRTTYPGIKLSILWYADAILRNGFMQNLNLPYSHWKYGAAHAPDIMELENYGQVTPNFSPQALDLVFTVATGTGGYYLGYPLNKIRYYAGIATDPAATQVLPIYFSPILTAINKAIGQGWGTIILWSYPQVAFSGYLYGPCRVS